MRVWGFSSSSATSVPKPCFYFSVQQLESRWLVSAKKLAFKLQHLRQNPIKTVKIRWVVSDRRTSEDIITQGRKMSFQTEAASFHRPDFNDTKRADFSSSKPAVNFFCQLREATRLVCFWATLQINQTPFDGGTRKKLRWRRQWFRGLVSQWLFRVASATMWPSSPAPPSLQPCTGVNVTHWHTFTNQIEQNSWQVHPALKKTKKNEYVATYYRWLINILIHID